MRCYEAALQADAGLLQASRNLAGALLELDPARAALELERAVAWHPQDAQLHFLLGNLLRARGEEGRAIEAYRRTIALEGPGVDVCNNLGAALQDAGRFEEALASYDEAVRCDPGNDQARFNRGLLKMLLGRFEGLAEYELRWRLPDLTGRVPQFARPEWDGASLAGRTLLLYTEQGFGDSLQFARYVAHVSRLAAQTGGRVLLHCPLKLRALLQRSFPEVPCFAPGEEVAAFDVRAPLLSLPRILGLRPDAVPTVHPYLRADAGVVARHRRALGDARLNVGLCWTTDSPTGQHRAIPAPALAALAGIPGVRFFNLQRGLAAGQPVPPLPLATPPELKDFDDDAAFVQALDLVITMDTALAHLAGAVGGRVWTVLSFPPDWRWGLASGPEGESTPWYPSMRLFRPARKGDWSGILARVAEALRGAAQGGVGQ